MENGILVGLSRQSALRRDLDVVANNLANVNTTGFKRARAHFESFVPPQPAAGPRGGRPVFVRDVATVTDTAPGRLDSTGNPFDLAIRGDGYFVVDTDAGPRYTRDGHFHPDQTGRMVTESGEPLLSAGGQPIVVPLDDGDVVVASDGTVSTNSGPIDSVGVVRFDRPAGLRREGTGYWSADEKPAPVPAPEIVAGSLERSNVEPILEITRMIRVHRAYSQARQIVDQEHDRITKMIEIYRA
jgi:flagellar basal-body rod protein FlgF